jgi:hypothetical protein
LLGDTQAPRLHGRKLSLAALIPEDDTNQDRHQEESDKDR